VNFISTEKIANKKKGKLSISVLLGMSLLKEDMSSPVYFHT
jgi:hypothetical protein